MPIKNYGVWAAYPISFTAERDAEDPVSPHISLYFDEDKNAQRGKHRAAINVKSVTKESRLVYWFYRDFKHPIIDFLGGIKNGFHPLPSDGEDKGLDYIRGNVLKINDGTLVQHDLPGDNNDIIDYVSPVFTQAINSKAKIFLFGEPFTRGGTGIHDVHMNQGNTGSFARDNGVYQDGGIIIAFPDGHFEAILLAFATQIIHTDDISGNAIGTTDFAEALGLNSGGGDDDQDNSGGDVPPTDGEVIIQAALVNPLGPDNHPAGQAETVYLDNRTPKVANISGWSIVNRQGQAQKLDGTLEPHNKRPFAVPQSPLSNRGGTITLLNKAGLKVHGVSYTAQQARQAGNFLFFT